MSCLSRFIGASAKALVDGVTDILYPTLPNAHQQAKFLVQSLLGWSSVDWLLRRDEAVCSNIVTKLEAILAVYVADHKPFSRSLGQRTFWKHSFVLNAHTLDPRPETEGLIELILGRCSSAHHILDLGTGTGCLLLSLLHEYPQARGVGVDIEPQTLLAAGQNAYNMGLAERVTWRHGSWLNGLPKEPAFDIIVANPPYIPQSEFMDLPPDVQKWDPIKALVSGHSGVEAYQQFAPHLCDYLSPGGCVAMEIGQTQAPLLTDLLKMFFTDVQVFQDLAGRDRYILLSDHVRNGL